jgi:hypothetical protein
LDDAFNSRALFLLISYLHRRIKTVILVTNYLTKGTLSDCEGHAKTSLDGIEHRGIKIA